MNKAKATFTLVSFNVFGAPFFPHKILRSFLRTRVRRRFRQIALELSTERFDILALQEVYTYPHFFFLRRHLSTFPYVAYARSLYGPRGGLVIFSKIPFKRIEYSTFHQSGAYWNKSVTGPLTRKGMLLVKLRDHPLWLINTHLTQNIDFDWSTDNRFTKFLVSQLEQCADTIKTLNKTGISVLIVGDFNMPKDSLFYPRFLIDANVKDVFTQFHFTTDHRFLMPKKKIGRIDYMFQSKDYAFSVVETTHLFRNKIELPDGRKVYLSDHMGLMATFRFRQ